MPWDKKPLSLSSGYSENQILLCPICSHEYVHQVGTRALADGDDYRSGWVRGPVTRLHFWAECSHHFSIDLGFHKGYTLVRYAPEWYEAREDSAEDCGECRACRG